MLYAAVTALAMLGSAAGERNELSGGVGSRDRILDCSSAGRVFGLDGQDSFTHAEHSRKMLTTSLGEWLQAMYPPESQGSSETALPPSPEPTGAGTGACGDLLPDVDFVGNDIAGYTTTATADECKDVCAGIDGCNAMSWHDTGPCYPKNIPDTYPETPVTGYTSARVCSDAGASGPAPDPVVESTPEETGAAACGDLLPDVDFSGGDVDGYTTTATAAACKDVCAGIDGCNAMSWHDTGPCYPKNIPDTHPETPLTGYTSARVCSDAGVSAPAPDLVADSTSEEPAEAVAPVEFDSRSTPHPDTSPHPLLPPEVDEGTPPRTIEDVRPLEQGAHAWFDYQIGGAYNPSLGTRVVSRDWYYGLSLWTESSYSICHVNAFLTEPDGGAENAVRSDATINWPTDVVRMDMEDPDCAGKYLIDISTPEKREMAAAHVLSMVTTCEDKLFAAVEFDNLDSFMRFTNCPFTEADTVEYAKLLVSGAHNMGLAVAQKNTIEMIDTGDYQTIGFDFALVEDCGKNDECAEFRDAYGGKMLAVEYTEAGFEKACATIGDTAAVVMRDTSVSTPDDASYEMRQCGP